MKKFDKKNIFNKHFFKSFLIFIGVLIVVLTFISFLEEIKKKNHISEKNIEEKIKV